MHRKKHPQVALHRAETRDVHHPAMPDVCPLHCKVEKVRSRAKHHPVLRKLPGELIHRVASYVIIAEGVFHTFQRLSLVLIAGGVFMVIEVVAMVLLEGGDS